MAGTVKLCVPELEPELVAFAAGLAFVEVFGLADVVADDVALAEWVRVGVAVADEDELATAGADVVPGIADDAGAATDELDVLVPHAATPTPPMMTAITAAGTRRFLMLKSSVE
jgi:hypothetical protein